MCLLQCLSWTIWRRQTVIVVAVAGRGRAGLRWDSGAGANVKKSRKSENQKKKNASPEKDWCTDQALVAAGAMLAWNSQAWRPRNLGQTVQTLHRKALCGALDREKRVPPSVPLPRG